MVGSRLGIVTLLGAALALPLACSSEPSGATPRDEGGAPGLDAAFDASPVDGGALDTEPPSAVTDLGGQALTHAQIRLTWTAPGDSGGAATSYEIRYSTSPISGEAAFAAATSAIPPTPLGPGATQQMDIGSLAPDTTCYVAMRSRDAAGNVSARSNVATIATKARATFLVGELAVANTAAQGSDFVELIAVKGGWADAIEVRQSSGSLYELGPVDIAAGERVVVHLTNVPGPMGYAQEDTTKDKTSSTAAFASAGAWDVYSTKTSVIGTDNLIEVLDGTAVQDAVAISNRDGDASPTAMGDFAAAHAAGTWVFSAAPVDGANECETQKDAAAVTTGATENVCGAFETGIADGVSLNRKGTTDTSSKKDFYVAAQTPGDANTAPPPAPKVLSALAPSSMTADVHFDQELDPATVAIANFDVTGLTLSAAALVGANHVSLTTSAQSSGGYVVTARAGVASLAGVPVDAGNDATRFCGYSTGATLAITEVNPRIDLIELTVTNGGPLAGFTVRRDPYVGMLGGTLLATLPPICAATNDVIVIHLDPGAGAPSESIDKNQYANAAYPTYYDTAWDVASSNTQTLPHKSSLVVAVRAPSNTYVDAAAFSSNDTMESGTYDNALTYLQGLGLWTPANCGGAACSDLSTPRGREIAANWLGVDTTASGNSCRRSSPTSTRVAASWSVSASTFGQ